jgi:hypothetical protein
MKYVVLKKKMAKVFLGEKEWQLSFFRGRKNGN